MCKRVFKDTLFLLLNVYFNKLLSSSLLSSVTQHPKLSFGQIYGPPPFITILSLHTAIYNTVFDHAMIKSSIRLTLGLLFSFFHLDYNPVFSLPFTVITTNLMHCPPHPVCLDYYYKEWITNSWSALFYSSWKNSTLLLYNKISPKL